MTFCFFSSLGGTGSELRRMVSVEVFYIKTIENSIVTSILDG